MWFCVVWKVVRNWMIVDGTLSPVCQQNMAIIQSDKFDTLAWFWVTPFNPNAHHHRILCEDNVLVCLFDCLPACLPASRQTPFWQFKKTCKWYMSFVLQQHQQRQDTTSNNKTGCEVSLNHSASSLFVILIWNLKSPSSKVIASNINKIVRKANKAIKIINAHTDTGLRSLNQLSSLNERV